MNRASHRYSLPTTARPLQLMLGLALAAFAVTAPADETCMSPYMQKIAGQEDYVYVWTLGMSGLGDEQDKLVTIAVNPAHDNYGQIIDVLSVGGRNEAHHSGLTDDSPLPVGRGAGHQ